MVSSLVCSVADKASIQRQQKIGSEEREQETKRILEAASHEGEIKRKLGALKASITSMQEDLNAERGWQQSVDELESNLMGRIEELKAMMEVSIQ